MMSTARAATSRVDLIVQAVKNDQSRGWLMRGTQFASDKAGETNTISEILALASPATPVTVGMTTPTVTLTSSVNPSTPGQAVTFTATVGSGVTGTVTFKDGTTVLGTGTVNNGVAVYDTYGGVGGWLVFGGTSVGAPIIAGVYGLAGNAASIDNKRSERSPPLGVRPRPSTTTT